MKYDNIAYVINVILFAVLMLAIFSEWIFGWPTNQHLLYGSTVWLVFAIVSNLYATHLDSKDEV